MKRNKLCSLNLRCECLYFTSIRLSAVDLVDYLFLPTKCFNRGKLIWNCRASPKTDFLISYMLMRNIQGQHYIWNLKSTCNWYDFELHALFFHIVSKGEMCITSHTPLWCSMVYCRIMTATFFFHFCNNCSSNIFLQATWTLHIDSKTEISKKPACPEIHLKQTVNALVYLLLFRTFIALRHPEELHLTFRRVTPYI